MAMSEDEIRKCRAAFDLCDKNHDKSISTKELIVALRKLGLEPSEKEVKKIIKEVDRNSDDRIDFNEFLLMVKKKHEISEIVQSFVKLFQSFDVNRDGVISRSELRNAMKQLGEQMTEKELDELIATADVDKDGKVNYEEFALLYSTKDK